MKIILSRKGFDSKFGGGPSLIVDGEQIVSLPIPSDKEARRTYADLRLDGQCLGQLIEQLHPKRRGLDHCHFDPDLRRDMLPSRRRSKKWRPLFGQVGSAATHLIETARVEAGDIFVFFGLFRRSLGWRQFDRHAPRIHLIHSWMQIDEIVHDPVEWAARTDNRWATHHPHTYGNWWPGRNVLFVGKRILELPGGTRSRRKLAGTGLFERYDKRLQLSDPATPKHVSKWRLPSALEPDPLNGKTITYLSAGTWTPTDEPGFVRLDPGRATLWQEAVISNNPDAVDWIVSLVRSLGTSSFA